METECLTICKKLQPMLHHHGIEMEDIAHDMHQIALELITDLKNCDDPRRKEKLFSLVQSVLHLKDFFLKMQTVLPLPSAVLS